MLYDRGCQESCQHCTCDGYPVTCSATEEEPDAEKIIRALVGKLGVSKVEMLCLFVSDEAFVMLK
jgi:hypothetical protein